ncbi:hypothetical protein AME01nite_02220 [Acidomonas methanolica NBRC 104435]|nr:hypothetical protein AME01nite_02220 [Acidomonas methanolica NBRC 104435]
MTQHGGREAMGAGPVARIAHAAAVERRFQHAAMLDDAAENIEGEIARRVAAGTISTGTFAAGSAG